MFLHAIFCIDLLLARLFENELSSGFLKVISLKYNSGSSGSYCEALAHLNSDWSYVLKMDEDLILDKNCLAELVNEAVKSKKYSFIGGKVFFYKEIVLRSLFDFCLLEFFLHYEIYWVPFCMT